MHWRHIVWVLKDMDPLVAVGTKGNGRLLHGSRHPFMGGSYRRLRLPLEDKPVGNLGDDAACEPDIGPARHRAIAISDQPALNE